MAYKPILARPFIIDKIGIKILRELIRFDKLVIKIKYDIDIIIEKRLKTRHSDISCVN